MICTFMIVAATAAVLALSPTAFAQQPDHGTADEARAMLGRVVAAVKADKTKALDTFNKGEGGFLDRDLYSFCFDISDGKIVAVGNPKTKGLLGLDRGTLKDATLAATRQSRAFPTKRCFAIAPACPKASIEPSRDVTWTATSPCC